MDIEQYDIILVEDNHAVAAMTRRALGNHQMADNMKWFEDAEGAEEFFFSQGYAHRKELHPYLILLDLNLPLMSGHDFLEIIKSNEATSHIPVVMFSSSEDQQDIDKSYTLGANGYVVKSSDPKVLMDTVADTGTYWLNRNRPARGGKAGQPGVQP
ncbi:response regulator [Herbaspirillum sp. alder98]|uniref:response regulator n=1 Tax=Herbaspirillum sp. alder98 TaxID=2913096 RepID=UPI001CD8322F|nr:response regulator [Herbaspirillum sp. alder98]MCA1324004.1 response regulator [Herbaspirillum sp. alder98]